MKKYLHKLPFKVKLWWAKQFIHMFKGFGVTFNDDIVLYNELKTWIDTKGKPTSSTFKSE
jgi:hypothetical protein